MSKNICVYGSSSKDISPVYMQVASELGSEIARRNYHLVYGGACIGLMGEVARAVHIGNGYVVGVIPHYLNREGITYQGADELIVTDDLRSRKEVMESRSSAFIALPGGFGTVEELMEIITLKQLRVHSKPIVVLNALGFYDPLEQLFEHIYNERCAKHSHRDLYYLASDINSAFDYIENYSPVETATKW